SPRSRSTSPDPFTQVTDVSSFSCAGSTARNSPFAIGPVMYRRQAALMPHTRVPRSMTGVSPGSGAVVGSDGVGTGAAVGWVVGFAVGSAEGAAVGFAVGSVVGAVVGAAVGFGVAVGFAVAVGVGEAVGFVVAVGLGVGVGF